MRPIKLRVLLRLNVLLFSIGPACISRGAEPPTYNELLAMARTSLEAGKVEESLKLLDQAIASKPKDTRGWFMRGVLHERLARHAQAIADYDQVIELDPKADAAVYNRRGSEHFKAGHIRESIADFDKFIAQHPDQERSHWQRGISYYYAGRFADGTRQFEGYQTFDDNDVENAVWRYLCMARDVGVPKARASILKIKNDSRVPMAEIHRLYAGELQPNDVLAAAQAGNPSESELNNRLFYAHLYLGLYYEAAGDKKLAQQHIARAANDHKIGHYMWDVARVHAELLKKLAATPNGQ